MILEPKSLEKTAKHEIIYKELFINVEGYNKFLNWVSGEFDLYLQDKKAGLKIFFPNGSVNITQLIATNNQINAEISINTSDLNRGTLIMDKIQSVYNHFNRIYN